jgi:fructosamine-3-kinase
MDIDLDSDESTARLAVYQLYHVLNHVNIFGHGYLGQAMSLAQRLT